MKRKLPKFKINETMIKEVLLVLGFISFVRGLYIIHPAAAWGIGGIILIWFGYPGKAVK